MQPLLAGKVALVAGAASGIGRASALALAREGARAMCSDLDARGAADTAAAIRTGGGEARASFVCSESMLVDGAAGCR